MAQLPLSVCLIVRNEASLLARCLESVMGMAREIIVADTGSTDGSREIAEAYGARVIDVPWTEDFAAARNAALAAASEPWVMMLDADEWLPVDSVTAVAQILPQVPEDAVVFGRRIALEHGVSSFGVMIWPTSAGLRFRGRVHEVLDFQSVPTVAEAPDVIVLNQRPGWDQTTIDYRVDVNRRLVMAELEAGSPSVEILMAAGDFATGESDTAAALSHFDDALAHADCHGHLQAMVRLRRVTALVEAGQATEADDALATLCSDGPMYLDARITAADRALARQDWASVLTHASKALRLMRYDEPQFHQRLQRSPGDVLEMITTALAKTGDGAGAEACRQAKAEGDGDPILIHELGKRLQTDILGAWHWYVLLFAPPGVSVGDRLQAADPADVALVRVELIDYVNQRSGSVYDPLPGLIDAATAFASDRRLAQEVSRLMVQRQDWPGAWEWIASAFARGGGGGELEINRGLIAVKLGQYDEAAAAFERAMTDAPFRVAAEGFLTQLQTVV